MSPADFKAVCFEKGSAGTDAFTPPAGAVAKPATVAACGGLMACPQFIDSVSLGCVAKGPNGQEFKSLQAGNNSCALVGLRSQVCAAGLNPNQVTAKCFRKQ